MNDNSRKKIYRWLWRSAVAIGLFTLAMLTVWILAPFCVEDPLPLLLTRKPATIVYDLQGTALYAHPGTDAQWRFDVPLEAIHPEAIRATLIVEDADFYDHHGVDYGAALRAAWQNLSSGRILSGASTISMQVASLATGRQGGLWGKFLQAARARKMERLHTKEEILTAYLNHAPFGGRIVGIEAASRFYFQLSAKNLTFAEATLLCGIPQRPNAFRLDRHLPAARQRQWRLLQMMVRREAIDAAAAETCFHTAGLRLRDFSKPADFLSIARPTENIHALRAGYPIRADWQTYALNVLSNALRPHPTVRDGACVVIDRAHPEAPVLYLGTLNFDAPQAGQVDAAAAQRSAGSVLKPFIYATAIEGGQLAPDTLLLDAPVRYNDYAPTNYDDTYRGWQTAQTSLADSLNTPVIRLLHSLGIEHVKRRFQALGLPFRDDLGLTMALGTGGASLLEITNAYHRLPEVFSPETEILLASMLRRPLPHTSLDVAWKTGTSNHHTDAWCVGWTPEFVVGVWFGNKSGERSEALVGVELAAPVVGDLFNLLYIGRPHPFWDEPSSTQMLCEATGLRAAPHCQKRKSGFVHPRYPLLQCTCWKTPHPTTPLILSPLSATYCGDPVILPLISTHTNVVWYLNGARISTPQLLLTPGVYTLQAIAGERVEKVNLFVKSKP